jgi:hypothetical protein
MSLGRWIARTDEEKEEEEERQRDHHEKNQTEYHKIQKPFFPILRRKTLPEETDDCPGGNDCHDPPQGELNAWDSQGWASKSNGPRLGQTSSAIGSWMSSSVIGRPIWLGKLVAGSMPRLW